MFDIAYAPGERVVVIADLAPEYKNKIATVDSVLCNRHGVLYTVEIEGHSVTCIDYGLAPYRDRSPDEVMNDILSWAPFHKRSFLSALVEEYVMAVDNA
jgi:hypothetical protein